MKSNSKFRTLSCITILIVCYVWLSGSTYAAEKEWDTKFKPGDKVCLYDIEKSDPLVDNESNDSLKYWYRQPIGDQRSVFRLRPLARDLKFRVLYPGIAIAEKDGDGYWFRGQVVVIKGGATPGSKAYPVKKGSNVLLRDRGRSIVMDWQVLTFEKARFKKDVPGPFGCRRKYPKY